jgi:hypothetical protein
MKLFLNLFRATAILVVALLFFVRCNQSNFSIKNYKVKEYYGNYPCLSITVSTKEKQKICVKYWVRGNEQKSITTQITDSAFEHSFTLKDVLPDTTYFFQFVLKKGESFISSDINSFKTSPLSLLIKNVFNYSCFDSSSIPSVFSSGMMLVNRRVAPGGIFLLDSKAKVLWKKNFQNLGVKVAHFTQDNTIISILGMNNEPTSYGSQIIELNEKGDTLTYLKKGMSDFKYSAHHEVFKNQNGNIVFLYVEKRPVDLSSIGGNKKDTICADGIQILNKKGKELWRWSALDVIDPLKEKDILKEKKDWMHANSLSIDKDGNYLLSFFNTGQVWKIDSKTGKLIWRFGKFGNIKFKSEEFTQSHAFYNNKPGSYLFFDNGLEKKQSCVRSYRIDENKLLAYSIFNFNLPLEFFSDRMGSSYMINDSTILSCSSKSNSIVLTNIKGDILCEISTDISPYRAEFIEYNKAKLFLK